MANQAIKEKVAACVNIIPSHSVYSWNDSVESSDEFLTIFKTTNSNVSKLRNLISARHSYDVPEIIDFELNNVNKPYLDWLIQSMS